MLHAPQGMTIVGETLWVADLDALRGCDRGTGVPVANIDPTSLGALVPNDVDEGPDDALYVTDTGQNRVYRLAVPGATTVIHVFFQAQDDIRAKLVTGVQTCALPI